MTPPGDLIDSAARSNIHLYSYEYFQNRMPDILIRISPSAISPLGDHGADPGHARPGRPDRTLRHRRQARRGTIKGAVLKAYPGLPHGMPATRAETINADILAFIQG